MNAEPRPDGAEQDLADEIDDIVPSHGYRKVPVVGLGGSAGSIEALQSFFSAMPGRSGVAFVVVIHLASEHESMLTDVLQRSTSMKVVKVEGSLDVRPDTVYVIPPGRMLQSRSGRLHVGELPLGRAGHVVVDVFFRTLADSHAAHAAAVVLSGMDGDGTLGVKRIKERGGLTVAQDPGQAMHPSMPRSAIGTGMVDWVLPVQEMPARLLSYFRLGSSVALPAEEPPTESAPRDDSDEDRLREVLAFVRNRTNRDFSQYKRATVLRRIGRRMQVNGVDNLQGYLTVLRTRPGECVALLQDLLISVTNFFRDAECWQALQPHMASLFEGKGPGDVVRAWTIACATGEEAYSVAMMLAELAREMESPPLIQVFATDLDEQAVQVAREGLYPDTIVADVSEERLRRFFTKEHGGYRIRRELREMVLFAVHDVLRDSPFSRLDLVSCRNMLIYLTRDAQARIFDTVHFALVPHGKLFLGGSEAVDEASEQFALLDKNHRIYAQRPARRAALPLPAAAAVRRAHDAQQHALAGPVVAAHAMDPLPGLVPATFSALQSRPRDARHASWAELHLELLESLAPPSVLVNGDYDIVHLSPSAGRFLQMSGGEPSRNLLRVLQPEVRIDLRAALYQAQQGQEVRLARMELPVAGGTVHAALRVVPVSQPGEPLFLVSFEVQQGEPQADPDRPSRLQADPMARHLDAEIDRLKMQLRETVEQYEASTEELKASNEELQAMNEELRAATEELETSREELQSINEELTTVNAELKNNVDQLSHANSDMHNLMDATSIATVFVDRDLRIMRYTPAAIALFNLIPSDVGRPLTDLGGALDYPELGADAGRVLERLAPVEREVGQPQGNWFLARLMPYRTLDDRIAGVVLTFIDITERKQAEETRLWLAAVVSSTSDAIISFAPDQTILSWNSGAQKLYGYSAEEAIGQPLSMLASSRQDAQDAQDDIVQDVLAGRGRENFETVRRRKDGSEVHVALNVSPVRDSRGRVVAGTATARDITAQRAATEALRQSEERMRMVVENALEYAIFSTDLERRVTTWNSGAERLLGFTEQEIIGQPADVIFTPEDRQKGEPEKESRTARRKGRASDERIHMRKDGSRFRGTGTMMLMRNPEHEPVGFVKILRDLSDHRPAPE